MQVSEEMGRQTANARGAREAVKKEVKTGKGEAMSQPAGWL